MTKTSFILGLAGIFLTIIALMLATATVLSMLLSATIGFFGIDTSFFTSLGLVGFIISIIALYFTTKLIFENETSLLKLFIGLAGILIIILGVIIGLLVVETIIGIFFALIIISVGISFIGYGFNIDALKPMTKLIDNYKRMIK